MEPSIIIQKFIQRAWERNIVKNREKAKMFLPKAEIKLSIWKEWKLQKKGFQPSHYRLGARKLMMV